MAEDLVYKMPVAVFVNYALSNEFVSKINAEKDCKVERVIERINCKLLEYYIDCPKEKEKLIVDYGFMSFIKNPKFQKYYGDTEAFAVIAAAYAEEVANRKVIRYKKKRVG